MSPSEALVHARDQAVLARIRTSPATVAELLRALPEEPGQTAVDRQRALTTSLSRLRLMKRAIVSDGTLWKLT